MKAVVLMFALAVFFLISAVLSTAGARIDSRERRLSAIRSVEKDFGDEELKKSFAQRVLRPITSSFASAIKMIAGKNTSARVSRSTLKLDRMLKSAGLAISAQEFIAAKTVAILFVTVGGLVGFRLIPLELTIKLAMLSVCVIICILGPKYYLEKRIKSRRAAIVRDLPDVMDLLVVSVEAGLGLDAAISKLYAKNKCVVLQELASSVRDVQMGLSRRSSLKDMADRCDVKELTSFVTALVQAEQLGVSVKSVLVSQADRLRVERLQRIKEKAMKAPIKMMLPMVGFIFPVMFIILLGPAAMNLLEAFS